MKRFAKNFSILRIFLLFIALSIAGVVVCWIFYPEKLLHVVQEQANELSCGMKSGSGNGGSPFSDIVDIYGYWSDDATSECWYYDADGFGLYWDATESSEEQADTGSGRFRWKYDDGAGLVRYHWQDMMIEDYIGPDHADPCEILSLTEVRMEYNTVDGEYHSFTKFTKP